jgi:hypothetical protein
MSFLCDTRVFRTGEKAAAEVAPYLPPNETAWPENLPHKHTAREGLPLPAHRDESPVFKKFGKEKGFQYSHWIQLILNSEILTLKTKTASRRQCKNKTKHLVTRRVD